MTDRLEEVQDYPPGLAGTHTKPMHERAREAQRENYEILVANYTLYTVRASSHDEAEENALKEAHIVHHEPKGREVV